MIYLVSKQQLLFEDFGRLSVQESLDLMSKWNCVQFDTETSGLDPHIDHLLTAQFGSPDGETQIVVDCCTVNIEKYKELLESKLLIGHNIKFDLEFLYSKDIHPDNVFDTMIADQFLHLGWPALSISYSLQEVAMRYLNVYIDKTVRGQIIWRGIDSATIKYGAGDVTHLYNIAKAQIEEAKARNAVKGLRIECDFTPVCAYLEWCGIKLSEDKWKAKMVHDKENLDKSVKLLNDYCISNPKLKKWVYVNRQGDLWDGFDLTPKFRVDWQKKEAIDVFKALGFDTKAISKITGKETDSITEKVLTVQKGVDDQFLSLYLDYQGHYKRTTSFGQGHIDAINPITGRLHTVYRAIGTISGRMSSGSDKGNESIAKLKGLPASKCKYPNMQQLPHDAETRACFVAEPGNLFCSCDYSAMEARIGAEVYNEKKLLDEFLYGSGDSHAAYAKEVFPEELKDIPTSEIKKKRPDLRSKVKSIEFAIQFGSDGTAVAPQLGISVSESRALVMNLLNGMDGLKSFKEKGAQFVLTHGYVVILPSTGHRAYWHDWEQWKELHNDKDFWREYANHKGTGDEVCAKVRTHFKAKAKWCDRLSLNLPTQGGGAVVLKVAATNLYKWVVNNGYWGKILFVNFTHDEINSEFPEELKDTYPQVVSDIMQQAAAQFYHKLPIPAEPAVGEYWIH